MDAMATATDLEPGDPRRKEMCPLVDTCPETCAGEFWATAGACIALSVSNCCILSPSANANGNLRRNT